MAQVFNLQLMLLVTQTGIHRRPSHSIIGKRQSSRHPETQDIGCFDAYVYIKSDRSWYHSLVKNI